MENGWVTYLVVAEKHPGPPITVAYRSLAEARKAAASLEQSGYRILKIAPKA